MGVSKKKILFVLLTAEQSEFEFVKKLSQRLKEKGHEPMFFFMSENVKLAQEFDSENTIGYLCSRNAHEFGISEEKVKYVSFGSQYNLSQMVEEADKVIVFA